MQFYNYKREEVFLEDKDKIENIKYFLEKFNLNYKTDITHSIIYKYQGEIIATGSISGYVLKCIAIHPDWQGEGLLNQLITELIRYEYNLGNRHLFVFTKPKYMKKFEEQGFEEIETIKSKMSLLEFGTTTIKDYQKYLHRELDTKISEKEKVTGLVVNCNPFTYGHQYLVKKASAESDLVIIFVVKENRSVFPTAVRYKLVKKGTNKFNNVEVVKGGDYIISSATFPSYFTQQEEVVSLHAILDLNIFGKYIAPTAGINWRYVGKEPYCNVTSMYNKKMHEILPEFNIRVKEIERKKLKGDPISASKVRQLIKEDKINKAKYLVPAATYDFLKSSEAEKIIKKIKESNRRH